jgi:hypothetical protein
MCTSVWLRYDSSQLPNLLHPVLSMKIYRKFACLHEPTRVLSVIVLRVDDFFVCCTHAPSMGCFCQLTAKAEPYFRFNVGKALLLGTQVVVLLRSRMTLSVSPTYLIQVG